MAPTLRLGAAVAALVAISLVGLAVTVLGLVPHRQPSPAIRAADQPHAFPDLEALLPTVVRGRAAELRGSFDGTDPADDESQYGGLYTALSAELGAGLARVEMAEEYIPGRTDNDWASVSVYRLPGRAAAGWQPTLDSLVAGTVPQHLWTFRRDAVVGRSVLVGSYDGTDEDWICAVGDLLVEIEVEDPSAAAAILSVLP
ncbi:MAG TPA: hypothetical protein VFS32_13900 [Candidatus Limnocylindrales bacterium]|nr:hypothetical protein [Candidatus Limnocylindrales bacterium]